jgi:hypothetical protein
MTSPGGTKPWAGNIVGKAGAVDTRSAWKVFEPIHHGRRGRSW